MKREAEQTWAAERVENALLRERINDIAAEIARLTVALEGADSPIEAMLAGEPASRQRPAPPTASASRGSRRRRQGQPRRSHSRPATQGLAASGHELVLLRGIAPPAIHAMMRPRGRHQSAAS